MKIGIFGGDTAGRTIDDVVADARAAEADGFASYASPRSSRSTRWACSRVVGREVPRIELGTGVVPTYSRHPMTMAQQALTVQAASGGRFVLGIGLRTSSSSRRCSACRSTSPCATCASTSRCCMPLIRDGKVSFKGETISTEVTIGIEPRIPCPVLVAALGEQMLQARRHRGRRHDHVDDRSGHARDRTPSRPSRPRPKRRVGPRRRSSTLLPVCVTDDVDTARERAAQGVPGLRLPAVVPGDARPRRRGGPADVAIVGDEATVEKQVRALADAGVTEFVASVFGIADERARRGPC